MAHLPKPLGRQQEVVFMPDSGHQAVLGTAGSGKTTMAIHRAIDLQTYHAEKGEMTLLVTFNKMLVQYMKSFEVQLPIGLVIENYHKTARGFLHAIGKMKPGCILDVGDKQQLIASAVADARASSEIPVLLRPIIFFLEEIKWIQQFGVRTIDDYIAVDRVGRSGKGTRAERSVRPVIWDVYERYRAKRLTLKKLYDWDDIGITVEDELTKDNSKWRYRHVIIDEGQDFSPTMIRSLSASIPSNGSLTLFADVAQQIYGVRVSWKSAGLKVTKNWEFKENYRNTKEIAQLALALSRMPFFQDEPDLVSPNAPIAEGTLPLLLKMPSQENEFACVCQLALRYSKTQTVAILLRRRDHLMSRYISYFKRNGGKAYELHPDPARGAWVEDPGILVGTYQAAKGLEFSTVFLPYCNVDEWPERKRVDEVGLEDASSESARLLYVGITRARTQLIISHSNVITPLLPADKTLFLCREIE